MIVSDVINYAKYGELKSLAIKDDEEAILSYINLAMLALHGRFKLLYKEQILDLQDNIALYDLNSDCSQVVSVYNEKAEEYLINDDNSVTSVFTPSYNTLQIPNPTTGSQISVIYIANPTRLSLVTDEVLLPEQLLEPLLHYIGYRAHGALDGAINGENNTHLMRYESSVKRIKSLGLIREDVVPNMSRFHEGINDE